MEAATNENLRRTRTFSSCSCSGFLSSSSCSIDRGGGGVGVGARERALPRNNRALQFKFKRCARPDERPRLTLHSLSGEIDSEETVRSTREASERAKGARHERGANNNNNKPGANDSKRNGKRVNKSGDNNEGARRFDFARTAATTTTSCKPSERAPISLLDDYERRVLWRAARNHRQTDHYDHSLFGLDIDLDKAVARHQREAMQYNQDRSLKEEQAKQVAPNLRQSPIAIMSMNPSYELQNKPLRIEYPATVENLRLNNTGFSWEVKLPYQVSMSTALHGAHLQSNYRYRLDQFHCHWGRNDRDGSEHTVDARAYSAELHFVHYNMEKYHTLSKAARHPDGLAVLSVFIEALDEHHNHAELEKICAHLKAVQLKGEYSIIRQAIRIENLLPTNRSYWSYQGSLTTPPYLESVTWFVLKQPIKCNTSQIRRFRALKSSLRHDQVAPIRGERRNRRETLSNNSQDKQVILATNNNEQDSADDSDGEGGLFIRSNHRKTQPLNGRTIVTYDE